jgi:hypothetical protein
MRIIRRWSCRVQPSIRLEAYKAVVCAAPGSISATNQTQAVSKVRADEHTDVPRQGRLLVAAAVAGGQG